MNKIFRVIWS
ncbi:hypothetical protein GHI92_03960, partial [Glaesserella parasuis]|nr:hypothetical protein [Glaesserella parasuis]MWQ54566.1 hypothetical protein [Glaesserella parasuis]MWQ55486.1 hypothetical protein [Glaesserella parasuis]MWQ65486.1 hypothetical protein [Glaesserella parasuis]